jgi:hypothetical protein
MPPHECTSQFGAICPVWRAVLNAKTGTSIKISSKSKLYTCRSTCPGCRSNNFCSCPAARCHRRAACCPAARCRCRAACRCSRANRCRALPSSCRLVVSPVAVVVPPVALLPLAVAVLPPVAIVLPIVAVIMPHVAVLSLAVVVPPISRPSRRRRHAAHHCADP